MGSAFRVPLGPYSTRDAKLTAEGQRAVADWLALYPEPVKLLMKKHRKLAMAAVEILGDEEVDSLCRAGAARAALTFDPGRGFKFATYAGPYLRSFVGSALAADPDRKSARYGVGVHSAIRCGGGGETYSAFDSLPAREPEGGIGERDGHLGERVAEVLRRKLTDRERDVVTRRFGLDGGPIHTLADLAHLHGLSKERIRQIQIAALAKVRRELEARPGPHGAFVG